MWTKKQQIMPEKQKPHTRYLILNVTTGHYLENRKWCLFVNVSLETRTSKFLNITPVKNRRYNLSAHTQSHMHAHALSTILWVKAPSPICFINPNSPLHNWTKCSQEWKSTTTLPASCACVCASLCVCAPGLCVRAQVGDECDREK